PLVGDEAVLDKDVLPAIQVEIDEPARPGPASKVSASLFAHILERPVAFVLKQAVAPRVAAVELLKLGALLLVVEGAGDPLSRRGKHVAHVKVEITVVVIILPGNAHARADILDPGFPGGLGKGPIAVIPVEVVAPKVVGDIEVGIAIAIVIT